MSKLYHYLCLGIIWLFHTTWEKAKRCKLKARILTIIESSRGKIPFPLPQESGGLNTSEGDPKYGLSSFSHLRDRPTSRASSSLAFYLWKAKVEPAALDTPMKGFVDNLGSVGYHRKMSLDRVSHVDVQSTDPEWWNTPEHGDHGGFADESGQVGPRVSCHCQVCCSHSAKV